MTPVEILLISEKLSKWGLDLMNIEQKINAKNFNEIVNGEIFGLRTEINKFNDTLKWVSRNN